MTVIARYYGTMKNARSAAKELSEAGFADSAMAMVTMPAKDPEGDSAGPRTGEIAAAAIKAGKLLGDDADFYSSKLAPGNSLVVVDALFGQAKKAEIIMGRHDPLDIAPPKSGARRERSTAPDHMATPFSAMMGWSVLSNEDTPFSNGWGLSTKAKHNFSPLSRNFKPMSDWTFSKRFLGAGFRSKSATPFSSRFGMSMRSDRSNAPWTHSFGMPLLTDDATPLSRRIDMSLLSKRKHILTK